MATFEEQIEGITQIAIESSGSVPTQEQVNSFLNDGIKDLTNKVTRINPPEAYKFASSSTDSDGSGVSINGMVLSVVRENGSSSDVRPATPIAAPLRYLATDKDSFHYRSAFNPCYYTLDRKLYVLPTPSSSSTRAIVSHIDYATAVFSDSAIHNFPDEFEDLIMLYAAAMSCQAAANDIQNNMPSVPVIPTMPMFGTDNTDADLPTLPVLNSPDEFKFSFTKINKAITAEDFDKAGKEIEILSKNMEIFSKNMEISNADYTRDLEIFKADLERNTKNKDRETQVIAGEYTSEVNRFQYDINNYTSLVQEKVVRYKWFLEEYFNLMRKYNESLGLSAPQQAREPEQKEGRK
jgi:hypothetical protein